MDAEKEVERLLAEHGAVLKRGRKHLVYELPNGKTFTRPKTPSDGRGNLNSLSELKGLLGLDGERGRPGERRVRKLRPKIKAEGEPLKPTPALPSLADQLKAAALGPLYARINELEAEASVLRAAHSSLQAEATSLLYENHRLTLEKRDLLAAACECWWCRVAAVADGIVGGARSRVGLSRPARN